ncbi:odorant receptor 94b-like [Bradysia coprophila]|uniref:odorant receptor 94b-like n=1 Tax=Bradysia coprophila TaxID=38358 RepID=UPI00187D8CFE|nr:odorant receptor 94b-like [Bradysia coprophila]
MYSIGIDKVISAIINFFYFIGLWHRGATATARERRTKLLYYICNSLFLVSLVAGAITNEEVGKKIFLAEASIVVIVLNVKLGLLIWKQNRIVNLLNRVCNFTVRCDEDLEFFNRTKGEFIKFIISFIVMETIACFEVTLIPLVRSEKNLVIEIGFPWDYKSSEIAFWTATIFLLPATVVTSIASFLSMIIWYLLLSCSLRYDILGSEMKRMGQKSEPMKLSEKQKHNLFEQHLKECVVVHLHTRELTEEVGSFFAEIFLIQFGTSALCICGSIYCLVFDVGDSLLERCVYSILLFYCIADLFLITYFGNEIMLSSNRLSYSLFESEWTEQPQATKQCIIIFAEYLKQPHELLVGKLYPLTLETFSKILNSAYSMFNILKSVKE